jgi:spermidine/putrescine transport system ATP-binding protein
VFQDYALFPHMSVANNIKFGLTMKGVPKVERDREAQSMLELVGLAGMGDRRISQLSGGQRQRVALARSLVVDPDVLLLDEPLGALDLNLRRQMQDELKAIQQRVGTTFVHVTHDQDEAMNIADIIVVLSNGRIEDIGPPSRVYLKPGSRFTAMFMGDNNLFEGDVTEMGDMTVIINTIFGQLSVPRDAFAQDLSKSDPVLLGLRPEQIRIREFSTANDASEILDLGKAVLRAHTFAGTHYDCTLLHEGSNTEIRARFPQHAAISANRQYDLIAFPSDIVGLADG